MPPDILFISIPMFRPRRYPGYFAATMLLRAAVAQAAGRR
jgi:hypothetical protein